MLLNPKKLKFRKQHRGRLCGKTLKNNTFKKGNIGLQVIESTWITAIQIETIRKLLSKQLKKTGKYWLNIFPDKPITARAPESRMGSGKGNVKYWVAVVKKNTIIIELKDVLPIIAKELLTIIKKKLPVKTKIIFLNIL